MAKQTLVPEDKKRQMKQGAALYLQWFEDVLRQGLQYLENQPELIQSISRQLVDSGNSSMARQIRMAAEGIGQQTAEEWISYFTDQAIIARCLQNIEKFPPNEQLDILHLAGLQQRKKQLESQPIIDDQWIILGQTLSVLEQLTERRTYLQSQKKGKIALFLDYAFRSKKFDTDWQTGSIYQVALRFFPSSVPLRAQPESHKWIRKPGFWKGIHGWEKWAQFRKKQINRHPWLFSYPAVIQDVTLAQHEGSWGLSDTGRSRFLRLKEEDALRLAAFSLGQPFHIFGVGEKERFQLISLLKEDQVIPLDDSIWTL